MAELTPRDIIVRRAAHELRDGFYVNLGIGICPELLHRVLHQPLEDAFNESAPTVEVHHHALETEVTA